MKWRRGLGWLAVLASACGGVGTAEDGGRRAPDTVALDVEPAEAGACTTVVESHANEGHEHVASCSPVTHATNPPSSGLHYPDWTAYRTYASPVPSGFLVHDLEHGAVVIVYNCPDGCPHEVAAAQALIDGLPRDPDCQGPMKIVLAPDPGLDVRWAASAWTWTLRASCFDAPALATFIAEHYDGPDTEHACAGDLDRSATGWCP